MSGAVVIVAVAVILIIAYYTYGSYVARAFGLDPNRPTPAQTMKDGTDYVPAPRAVLLGHHFASIAGAGPIVGPLTAAIFGWVPALLWIVIGSIFAGAVHDFGALMSSLRHKGRSVGEVIGQNVGADGRAMFLIFGWLAQVLVLAAFAGVVAGVFVAMPALATSSILFIFLALGFGYMIYRAGRNLVTATVVGVALLIVAIYLGYLFPFQMNVDQWRIALLAYAFVAATLPVWMLLQPRDYLNSFLLYGCILGGAGVILFVNPTFNFPAYGGFDVAPIGWLFPMMFITIACGAISGGHALTASGTTSKQLSREGDAKLIGYGSMLIECMLATIAIVAVLAMTREAYTTAMVAGPLNAFANGMAAYSAVLGIPVDVAAIFFGLAASAFALTTLDTVARVCRYLMQELSSVGGFSAVPGLSNRYIATGVSVAFAGILIYSGTHAQIWPMFGAANQMLAGLTLLALTVWLANMKRPKLFVVVPMVFMMIVTLSGLAYMIYHRLMEGNWLLVVVCAVLFVLACVLVWLAYRVLTGAREAPMRIAGASGEEE